MDTEYAMTMYPLLEQQQYPLLQQLLLHPLHKLLQPQAGMLLHREVLLFQPGEYAGLPQQVPQLRIVTLPMVQEPGRLQVLLQD